MIKKFLLGISVSFLSFIGFSNGVGIHTTVGLDSVSSSVNSNYSITPLKGGAFLTNYLGISKGILALDKSRIFWRSDNGYPYVYLKGETTTIEGFFDRYYSCDLMSGDLVEQHCTETLIDYSGSTANFDKQVFNSFFKTVTQGQEFYFYNDDYRYVGATYQETRNAIKLCRNSEEIGKSFCFKGGHCYRSKGDRPSDCDFGYIINSKNLGAQFQSGLTFGLFPSDRAKSAPGQKGYLGGGNIDGSSSDGISVTMTGNLMYNNSCTNGYVIEQVNSIMGSDYISSCYAGTYNTGLIDNYFDGESYIYLYGLTYRDLFKLTSDGMSWVNWFSTYSDEITRYRNGSVGVNPFLGRPVALYTYFNNLYDNGALNRGNDTFLLGPFAYNNYCNLVLYSDYNSVYSGSYFSQFCDNLIYSSDSNIDINTGVVGDVDDDEILPPGSNNNSNKSGNIVSVSWSGVLSGDNNRNFDGKNFINDFYQKLISNYRKSNNNSTGIIPSYIIVFLVAIILFRFLRK